MASRRRIGVSIASTEAARRQLMHPVPCWEKVWVTPSIGSSSLKVYKWVQTEKLQQFDDDEEADADEPLAPLPDEPEVVEVDDDEQEETRIESIQHKDVEMDEHPPEMPPSPKPQLTLIQSNELDVTVNDVDGLNVEPSLNLDASMVGASVDDDKKGLELDISGLGPDGLQLGSAHDLSQLDPQDALLGGPLMVEGADPFAPPT